MITRAERPSEPLAAFLNYVASDRAQDVFATFGADDRYGSQYNAGAPMFQAASADP